VGDAAAPAENAAPVDGVAPEWTPPSWDDLVRQHSARVYRLAYRLTGNQHDAEDLTQEVFVRVFRSLASYTPGTFEGWLHRITTNLFLDMARRRQRIRFEGLGDEAGACCATTSPRPPRRSTPATLDTDVQQALEALAPEYRAAVVLCDIEGLSYEEIAATLGVKLGTVRSRIHRGRAQLRAALDHRPPPPPGALRRAAGHAVMTRHLGERLSALIDGELSDTQRERVLAHLAGCEDCRREAVALRLLKRRMHALGDAAAVTR
jgi:RNA polymerase sigma-70 factor (ECF subfamily)